MKEEERCSDDDGDGGDGGGCKSSSFVGVMAGVGRLNRRHIDMEVRRMISISAKETFPRVGLLLTVRKVVTLTKRGLQAVR